MSTEPESLILHLLRDMREKMATKDDIADLNSQMHTLRADVASDFLTARADSDRKHKDTNDQIVGLRRAVIEYHTTVIGHGVLISDLEARLRRVEQHLSIGPAEAH